MDTTIHSEQPDVLDYVSFVAILLGILCNILLIDTILHRPQLRTTSRLVLLAWSVSDMLYLFSARGFLHMLLHPFGLHVAADCVPIFKPHLVEDTGHGLLLQTACLLCMAVLCFTDTSNASTAKRCLYSLFVLAIIVLDLHVLFLKYELNATHVEIIRRVYFTLLVILIFCNEFQYFLAMCDDDIDMDVLAGILIRVNAIRIYVYNWCVVYFLKYIVAYSVHEVIGRHAVTKYFYVVLISLTMTAFLTAFYMLLHFLCADAAFRRSFLCTCFLRRRTASSINTDPNELSAIIVGTRYNALYYTTEYV